MTKKLQDATAEATATLIEARGVLEQWERRLVDAQAEVDAVESTSGEELLDDPRAAAEWPTRLRELRDQVTVAERSTSAAVLRAQAAERDWLAAQADLCDVTEVVPARKVLESHEARTRQLLAALEEHDGPYVTQYEFARAQWSPGVIVVDRIEPQLPASHALEVALARAKVRRQVLVAMAAGDDPAAIVAARPHAGDIVEPECYPEAVGPGGLVPAPVFRTRAEQLRSRIADLEAAAAELESDLVRLPERAAQEMRDSRDLEAELERCRTRLEEIPGELEAVRRELASLAGATAAVA